MKIKNKIEKELKAKGNFLVLLDARAENYFNAIMESLKLVLDRESKGIYVTISSPSEYLTAEMQKRSIKTDDVLFIDCVSSMAGEYFAQSENSVFVESPSALEEIGMHITSLLNKIESDKKFLIMDSFSTLLIYNSKNSVKEFAMFLINKLRLEGVSGILVVIEREVPDDLEQILIAMCDKVIHV